MSGDNFGLQTASGHLEVTAESKQPYADEQLAQLRADGEAIIARYPQKRSALLPMLHLIQSVDGYVTGRGIAVCAEMLGLTTAEVSGVATFYTQYKRHPNGEYTVGVCTNTLCAIMGGDQIWESVSEHLGIGHDETTEDGKITLERVECNAACDYAPVVMTNWEFFDNQTPESTKQLVDDLRAGKDVKPTRGPDKVCTFKQMSRTLAGFSDGLADQGIGAGHASLVGLELAKANGWTAPGEDDSRTLTAAPEPANADSASAAKDEPAAAPAEDKPAAPADEKATDEPSVEAKADDEPATDADDEPTRAVEVAGVTGASVGGAVLVEEAEREAESLTASDDAAATAAEDEDEATAEGLAADTEADEEIEAEEDADAAPAAATDAPSVADAESDHAAEWTDKPASSAEHEKTDGSPAAAPEAVDAESDAAKTDDDEPAASDDAKGQPSAKAPKDQDDVADAEPAPETDVPVGTPEAIVPGVPERGVAAGVDPSAGDQSADEPVDQTIPRSALRGAAAETGETTEIIESSDSSEADDATVSRASLREASAPATLISSIPTSEAPASESGMLPVFDEPAPAPAAEPAAPAEDDDVAAARARIAAVGRSTAAPVEAYEPDEAELTVARRGLAFAAGAYGDGSAQPGPKGEGPTGWTIKGNASSMLYHTPESPWYKRTKAEVWFRDEEAATAAGFRNALDRDKDGDES